MFASVWCYHERYIEAYLILHLDAKSPMFELNSVHKIITEHGLAQLRYEDTRQLKPLADISDS